MARRPRIQFPGAIYHVMSRGNRKDIVFIDDHDRRAFLAIIRMAVIRYGIRCYAWCLMDNHYHLIVDTPLGNLSEAMRQINGVFTQQSNRRHGRTGHVFEGRFRSIVIQVESYLRRAGRYVVLNPVKAGLVSDASMWAWSSYRATAGLEPVPSYLYVDWIREAFDGDSWKNAQRQYRLFVNSVSPQRVSFDLRARAIGSSKFLQSVRRATLAAHADRPLPRAVLTLARPSLRSLFGAIQSRAQRNQQIHLAHAQYGYSCAAIARSLGFHPSTVSAVERMVTAERG